MISTAIYSNVARRRSEWIDSLGVTTREEGGVAKVCVHVYLEKGTYDTMVPEELKGGVAVKFYPVLFQMGVDIKQWGSNLVKGGGRGSNLPGKGAASVPNYDEEGGGAVDSDLLTSLNHEAFQKLNKYAHKVNNMGYATSADASIPIHASLGALWDYVSMGAKKIKHGVLDLGGQAAQAMGGGSVVYCKSGKDRTGMGVTLREATHLKGFGRDAVALDAAVLRRFGTRLAVCRKNIGKWSYAFNALQAKFMPAMLKPPPDVLAALFDVEKVET